MEEHGYGLGDCSGVTVDLHDGPARLRNLRGLLGPFRSHGGEMAARAFRVLTNAEPTWIGHRPVHRAKAQTLPSETS